MLRARVLGVGLDALERGLGANALDLELRHEHRQAAAGVDRDADRALGGEEVEAREVLDVAIVEQDAAGEAVGREVLEQTGAPGLELGRRDAGEELHDAEE